MVLKRSKTFRDINLSFKMHPITNDLMVLKNEDAIKRSVINIVNTIIGDLFFTHSLNYSFSKMEKRYPELAINN